MKTIDYMVWTEKKISQTSIAEQFFIKAEELDIEPEYISLYEPINQSYDLESAVKLWTYVKGCEDSEVKGKSGMMLARNRSKSITYMVSWHEGREKGEKSWIRYWISYSKYKRYYKELFLLFQNTIDLVNATYAYVTLGDYEERQYYLTDSKEKLRGIFWCNYFGKQYIDLIGEANLSCILWHRMEHKDGGGLYTYLDESPLCESLKDGYLEEEIKKQLGYDFFLNPIEHEVVHARLFNHK